MKKAVRALPKGGIADALAAATSLKKSECSKVLDALAEVATTEVGKGKFVIPGLVMLKKKTKPARAAGTRLMFGKTVKVKAQKAKTIVKAYCDKADVREDSEGEGTESKDDCEGLLRQGFEGQHLRCWRELRGLTKRHRLSVFRGRRLTEPLEIIFAAINCS